MYYFEFIDETTDSDVPNFVVQANNITEAKLNIESAMEKDSDEMDWYSYSVRMYDVDWRNSK